jgi:hypothetical protein
MIGELYVCGFGRLPEGDAPLKPDLSLLAPALRRGLSGPTRMFMDVAKRALDQAQLPGAEVHVVFGSAFGEIGAAEQLMAQALAEDSSSPARFRHSVHNTAAGLFSISTHNRLPATAISAGWDTVAMGLLEAGALLAQGGARHVLLVFAEEPVPAPLSAEHPHGPLAAGFVLSREPGPRARGRLANLRRAPAAPPGQAHTPIHQPIAPCVALCRALETRARLTLAVGQDPEPWCVDVDAQDAA